MRNRMLKDIIALGEGFTIEFKQAGTSNLGREICAFANATGGVILIGVADSGGIVGVADHNRLKSEVQAIARSADPPIAVEIESIGDVLSLVVPEQHSKPYSFGGKFFMREGASSQQMSRNEIREFFFKEGLIHFDEMLCADYDLHTDLTPEIWTRFVARARLPAQVDRVTALRNLHLVKSDHMTYAGAWLLCDDITRYTLRAGVTCALFQGATTVQILDRRDYTGDLYSIYEDCMAYIQSRLNTALLPHAHGRDERLELPEDALREALVNGLVHRDYRSTANVQVHIYQDRLEIVTPGGLPAGMKEEYLGHKSVPRNPLLFGLFYRMRLVEQIGSGIQRIRNLCYEYGVAEPQFEIAENWVTVVFPRTLALISSQVDSRATQSAIQLATQLDPVEKVVALIGRHGELSSGQLRHALGIQHRPTFRKNYLHPALSAGLIEMTIPEKPSSRLQRYRLTAKGKTYLEEAGAGT